MYSKYYDAINWNCYDISTRSEAPAGACQLVNPYCSKSHLQEEVWRMKQAVYECLSALESRVYDLVSQSGPELKVKF